MEQDQDHEVKAGNEELRRLVWSEPTIKQLDVSLGTEGATNSGDDGGGLNTAS